MRFRCGSGFRFIFRNNAYTKQIRDIFGKRSAATFVFDVFAKFLKNIVLLAFGRAARIFQSEVHDVMVMNFDVRQLFAELQPNAVQEINFFWRQFRSMWPQIKNLLLAGRREDFKR